jgi:hypothetical protein
LHDHALAVHSALSSIADIGLSSPDTFDSDIRHACCIEADNLVEEQIDDAEIDEKSKKKKTESKEAKQLERTSTPPLDRTGMVKSYIHP